MKNRINIEPVEGGFKGFLYDGEILEYETPTYSDPALASKELLKHINRAQSDSSLQNQVEQSRLTASVNRPTLVSPPAIVTAPPAANTAPRKRSCCGG